MRAALVLSLVVACGGKSPPPQAPPPAHPAPLTIEEANPPPAPPPHPEMVAPAPPPPPAATAISPTLANDLGMLPVDSEVVVGVDIARISQSALWKQLISPMVASKLGWFGEFSKTCGFDPLASVTTIALGMKKLDTGAGEGVVVVHGMPTAQLGACMPKLTSNLKKSKSKTKLTLNKDTFTVVDEKNAKATIGFLDPQTMLVVAGPDASEAAWTTAKAGGSALSTSPAFMDMLHMISATDAVVALVNGNSLNKAAAMGIQMKAVFGSLDLTDALTLDVRMRLSSPDEAATMTSMVKGQIASPQVKQMFDRLDVSADGADVRIQVAMSAEKLRALAGMVGGMMGAHTP